MTWFVLVAGLVVAFLGSAMAAALVTTAQAQLREAISRRLRGTRESLAWITHTEREVVAATATASFGVGLVGAAIPGLFVRATPIEIGILVVFLAVPIALLGGYLLPRWLTVPRAEKALTVVRPLMSGWTTILGFALPARDVDPSDDVRALAREGAASGVESDELIMVGDVLTFSARPVRAVMTPRTDVVAVPRDADPVQIAGVFLESGYTRIPVYGESLDEVVGMIHAFDLFKYRSGDHVPLRELSFVPELRSAGDVLLDMQRDRQHLAVVVDEFGGTAGIVTLEDLLEALVGEIADEDDVAATVISPGASVLEIDGATAPSVIEQQFGIEFPASDAMSIGGVLASLAGRIPVVGERFTLRGLEIDVLQATPARVERLLIRRATFTTIPLDRTPP